MADEPGTDSFPGVDTSRPHVARVYNYLLGGKDHFEADRQTAEAVLRGFPSARTGYRENRRFLGRAVRYLAAEAGVRQFLDIGSGLPSANNVHEVAQRVAPDSRVVYADHDPLVLAHARALLTSAPAGRTAYIEADLREPEKLLADPAVRDTLDFDQPVALLLVAVLHCLTDDEDPAGLVRTLLAALPPGSYLVASHATPEHSPQTLRATESAYRSGGINGQARTSEEFGRLCFTGLDLVPPGVVLVSEWQPDTPGPRPLPEEVNCYGAVARKPA